MEKPSIRPLKIYRDNLNDSGRISEADRVQEAIELLQERNKAEDSQLFKLAEQINTRAIQFMRVNKIPFGKSLKGERTSWINDGGKFGPKVRVCQNIKGYLPEKIVNPRVGFKWDKYENGRHVGVRAWPEKIMKW